MPVSPAAISEKFMLRNSHIAKPRSRGERLMIIAAMLVALICSTPIIAAIVAALLGDLATWQSLAQSILPRATLNSFILAVTVGLGTTFIGTVAAWLVTAYRFPFSKVLEIALALPLAFPAYVMAYAYTDFLDHPGAVQSGLRELTGWGPRDYWFPEIRSVGGAAAMFILVLYPYVYLLARSAFLRQSPTAYYAARVLGAGPWRAFYRISMPMARPAIAGGVLLALMEVMADYGTVAHFSVQTYATGIYQSWFAMGDRAASAQLSLCLLVFVVVLVALERTQRAGATSFDAGRRQELMPTEKLIGSKAIFASIACFIPVAFGFFLPAFLLAQMAWSSDQDILSPRYLLFIKNSLTLAAVAALVTMIAAICLGFAARFVPGKTSRFAIALGRFGYAVPGGVIAVGLLVPFANLDNMVDAYARANWGFSTGLFFTGSIMLLVVAYMVRFLAPALNAFEAGESMIKPNMDAAARTLGHNMFETIRRVHLPMLKTALGTGLLIVFVDVMKELPATLIMRPFNYDTLAVQAHRLASDERLADAAVPSLLIVSFGLLPVILLCRSLAGRRHIQSH